ncbi:MAG TPA: hypothetical protein VF331_10035 [Polyangiales bacterium]
MNVRPATWGAVACLGLGPWGPRVAFAHAQPRHREPQPAALSWVRGPGAHECASARELADEVEQQLGHEVFVAPAQAGIAVEGFIDANADPAGYTVRFGLVEHAESISAERVLVLPPVSCHLLDPLLSFVLAAMLDPDAPLLPPRLPAGLSEPTRALLVDLFGSEPTVPPLALAQRNGKPVQPDALRKPAKPVPPPTAARIDPAPPVRRQPMCRQRPCRWPRLHRFRVLS